MDFIISKEHMKIATVERIVIILVGVILIGCASAQSWKLQQNKIAGYQAKFPVNPKLTVEENKADSYRKYKAIAKDKSVTYSIYVTDYRMKIDNIEKISESGFDAFVNQIDGSIEDKKTFKIGKAPGIEVKIRKDMILFINYRILSFENFVYQMMVYSSGGFAQEENVKYFFDSFKLLSK